MSYKNTFFISLLFCFLASNDATCSPENTQAKITLVPNESGFIVRFTNGFSFPVLRMKPSFLTGGAGPQLSFLAFDEKGKPIKSTRGTGKNNTYDYVPNDNVSVLYIPSEVKTVSSDSIPPGGQDEVFLSGNWLKSALPKAFPSETSPSISVCFFAKDITLNTPLSDTGEKICSNPTKIY